MRFEHEALEELRRLPGVLDATASIGLPVVGGSRAGLTIAGRDGGDGLGEVAYISVAPGFMSLWGIPILEGRDVGSEDRDGRPGAILINETAARLHWPAGDAVGARIWLGSRGPEIDAEWMQVVGIVADVRQHGPVEAVLPTMYGSTRQFSWPARSFTLRVAANAPPLTAAALRSAVHRVDPGVPVGVIRQGLTLGTMGVVLGVVLAAIGSRALQGMLLGVSPLDAATFATAIAVVMLLAGGAAWGPARNAGQVQPVEILNAD